MPVCPWRWSPRPTHRDAALRAPQPGSWSRVTRSSGPLKAKGREYCRIPGTRAKSVLCVGAVQFLSCKFKEFNLKSWRAVLPPAVLAGAWLDFASLELIPLGANKDALENEVFFSCSSPFKQRMYIILF